MYNCINRLRQQRFSLVDGESETDKYLCPRWYRPRIIHLQLDVSAPLLAHLLPSGASRTACVYYSVFKLPLMRLDFLGSARGGRN
eukprot:3651452-Pyramimonas_sp.AAC.2